MIYKGQKLSNP